MTDDPERAARLARSKPYREAARQAIADAKQRIAARQADQQAASAETHARTEQARQIHQPADQETST